MSDIEFVPGLKVSRPEKAPSYVLAKLWVNDKRALISALEQREGDTVNIELLVSKNGKPYAKFDNWKPEGKREEPKPARQEEPLNDDIPF